MEEKNAEKNGDIWTAGPKGAVTAFWEEKLVKSPRHLFCACWVAFFRNTENLWRLQNILKLQELRTEGAIKKEEVCLQTACSLQITLLIPLCPLRASLLTALPTEVLTGRFIKLSAVLRQFQRTYFATQHCRQVCCFVNATTLLPPTKYITGC